MENRKVILTPEEEASLYTMMDLYKHNVPYFLSPEELEKRLTEKMEPDKEAQNVRLGFIKQLFKQVGEDISDDDAGLIIQDLKRAGREIRIQQQKRE